MISADLHLHSTASDGTLSPAELVRHAHDCGITVMALTDHDNLSGIPEAGEEAKRLGMRLVPGVELSCGAEKEIHVLGYGFDPGNAALLEFCRAKRSEREERAAEMVRRLEANGMKIEFSRVLALAKGAPGRPHVARALLEAGHVHSMKEAFTKYLAPGKCGYVPKKEVRVPEAVELLREAGGIAVLAHPMQLSLGSQMLESLIGEWTEAGLSGVEVYHPSADAGDLPMLSGIAKRLGLLITGGSDFHGKEVKPDIGVGQGLSRWRDMESDVDKLLKRIRYQE